LPSVTALLPWREEDDAGHVFRTLPFFDLRAVPIGTVLNLRTTTDRYSSQSENNCLAEMGSGSEEGSYLRLIDFWFTKL
jgi:hypothetical protein